MTVVRRHSYLGSATTVVHHHNCPGTFASIMLPPATNAQSYKFYFMFYTRSYYKISLISRTKRAWLILKQIEAKHFKYNF